MAGEDWADGGGLSGLPLWSTPTPVIEQDRGERTTPLGPPEEGAKLEGAALYPRQYPASWMPHPTRDQPQRAPAGQR